MRKLMLVALLAPIVAGCRVYHERRVVYTDPGPTVHVDDGYAPGHTVVVHETHYRPAPVVHVVRPVVRFGIHSLLFHGHHHGHYRRCR